jgi:hypothetical protein
MKRQMDYRTAAARPGRRRRGWDWRAAALFTALVLALPSMQAALAASPVVVLFNPSSGPPGTSVTITGAGFNDASVANGVSFNGTAAASFTVESDVQITAIVPAGSTTGPITVTDSEGSSSSLVDFTVTSPPAPVIGAFAPLNGPIGTSVTLVGTGFAFASAVAFNGAPAGFTVDSDVQITAIVPAGSTTGPITVTNSEGSSSSLVDFTVTSPPERHNRSVTLRLTSHVASGRVRANDGFDRCESHARVRIERRRHGDWSAVGRDKASHGGRYRSRLRRHHGRFRAVVERQVMGTHNVCGRAVSWVRTST